MAAPATEQYNLAVVYGCPRHRAVQLGSGLWLPLSPSSTVVVYRWDGNNTPSGKYCQPSAGFM